MHYENDIENRKNPGNEKRRREIKIIFPMLYELKIVYPN